MSSHIPPNHPASTDKVSGCFAYERHGQESPNIRQDMLKTYRLVAKHLNAYGLEDKFRIHELLGHDRMITAAYVEGVPESLLFAWGDEMISDWEYPPSLAKTIIECLESGHGLEDVEGFDELELISDMRVVRPYSVEMEVNGNITTVDCHNRYDARKRAESFVHAFDDSNFDASAIIRQKTPRSLYGLSDHQKLCTFVNNFHQEVYE